MYIKHGQLLKFKKESEEIRKKKFKNNLRMCAIYVLIITASCLEAGSKPFFQLFSMDSKKQSRKHLQNQHKMKTFTVSE